MKVKAISRDRRDFTRARASEIVPVQRSMAPELHPFEKAREYKRAVNAVKLDRHFAKPFVGALSGHFDGVQSMAKNPSSLSMIVSGACDGEIRRWCLTEQRQGARWTSQAHSGFVRGLAFSRNGHHFVSASDDKTVKLWSASAPASSTEPLATYLGRYPFTGVDHHWKDHLFATSGATVQLWDTSRSEALQSFEWGADTVTAVRFNPAQHSLLCCLSADRGVTLYDVSSGSALQKMTMQTRANACCWNPMEPMHLTLASEDHDLYTFDMRRLSQAICVHSGHVSAVLDLDYSPTGTQFVSASYDKTLRLWNVGEQSCYNVYHTKRMQRLSCVQWSMDAAYLLSGSDDTNVRLWRAVANERGAPQLGREQRKREYAAALVEKHQHLPEVRRIKAHTHLPKRVLKAALVKKTVRGTQQKREKNRRAHSAPGAVPKVQRKKKQVWSVQE
mmetsp:Transcript_6835/g.22589  ORF Transcript_6835/g.22589 Transcript_6835/m.22589 type:complete len:446 (+) Transcript_6835:85-1422(+)